MPIKPGSPPPPGPKDKYPFILLLEAEYNQTRDELRSARVLIDNYDRELKKRKEELRKAYECIDHLMHQLRDAKNLSKIHEKKVFGAQVDTISISKVGEKVDALNNEIFQAATALRKSLVHRRPALSLADLDAAAAVSQGVIGEKMTNILITQSQKPEPEVSPLLVQVVLQIIMVKFCNSKIQSWCSDLDNSAAGGFLSAIYSDIRSTEEQAVSGRWRALTRAHTRPSTETWATELYQKLKSVLTIASWRRRSSESEDSFRDLLPSLFKAINQVRMVIGEKFTSADLDTRVFECNKIYNPGQMDDAYSDGRQSSGKRASEAIAGTTGIGLGKFISETKDVRQMQRLIRAKVVLWSTLNKALGPITQLKKPVQITDGANQDGRD